MKVPLAERCAVEDCHNAGPYVRGWCSMHYTRWKRTGDVQIERPSQNRGNPEARFFNRVTVAPDGCWVISPVTVNGYGRFYDEGRNHPAHRWLYERTVGPVPDHLQLDHLCRNRACVNPAHLEPVTARENTLRGETLPAANFRKSHCSNGHEFTPANTRIDRNGHRCCRACRAAMVRAARAKRKAANEIAA